MLEIIKIIVEILKTGLNGATTANEFKEKKRRRELGVELSTFYIELCRIIGTAKSIIHSLEVYAERMNNHIKTGNDKYALTAGSWIKRDIAAQKVNIARLSQSAKRLESLLVLMESKAGLELQILLYGKTNLLDTIYRLLSNGELPLDTSSSEYLAQLEQYKGTNYGQKFQIKANISACVTLNKLTTSEPWEIDTYKRVINYIEYRESKGMIEQLEELAEGLRKKLEENFTLTDILLDVQDSRHADGAEELLW